MGGSGSAHEGPNDGRRTDRPWNWKVINVGGKRVLEPRYRAGVFSEGGGGAAITMLALKLQEIDVSATVAEYLGVDLEAERWALGHPIVTAVIQPLLDAADPLHLARAIFREPLPGGRAHDLVMD